MPETIAHSLVAVPFARKSFVFSAVVVGTLAPDFEYFFRLSADSSISHTLPGLVIFCLPVGLALLWLWHFLLKSALVELVPDAHYKRLLPLCKRFNFGPTSQFIKIVFSILIGAFTHLAWDSLTHYHGWTVQQFSFLSSSLIQTDYGSLKTYRVLQHGSSLLGLFGILFFYIRWFRRTSPLEKIPERSLSVKTRILIISVILVSTTLLSLGYTWLLSPPLSSLHSYCVFIVALVIVMMAMLLVELIIFSLWWFFAGRKKSPGS